MLSAFFAKGLNSMLVPVQLVIENGNYVSTLVVVKKNGQTVFTTPGEKNLKLRLEFGNEYLLSFSKDGYITKTIHFDTNIPEDRINASVEPYKIGVRLFKQYQGVNIVVYNQPVASIKYLPDLDELGYDVDYSKSILSLLNATEKELELKAIDERKEIVKTEASKTQLESPPQNNKDENVIPKSETLIKQLNNDSNALQINKNNIVEESNHNANEIIPESIDHHSQIDQNNNGQDVNANVVLANSGDDAPKSIQTEEGIDDKQLTLSHSLGSDTIATTSLNNVLTFKKVSVINEPNRTITVIELLKGSRIEHYRKVAYVWGGRYYFKNMNTSISEEFFNICTGNN